MRDRLAGAEIDGARSAAPAHSAARSPRRAAEKLRSWRASTNAKRHAAAGAGNRRRRRRRSSSVGCRRGTRGSAPRSPAAAPSARWQAAVAEEVAPARRSGTTASATEASSPNIANRPGAPAAIARSSEQFGAVGLIEAARPRQPITTRGGETARPAVRAAGRSGSARDPADASEQRQQRTTSDHAMLPASGRARQRVRIDHTPAIRMAIAG